MRVLDLFSGLGGATTAFRKAGHDIVTVDQEEDFHPSITQDILKLSVEDLAKEGPFDFVWASPPCNHFSVLTISQSWDRDGRPNRGATRVALALVQHALYLIEKLEPRAWILENPVGMLRVQPFMRRYERRMITYCRYGMPYRKATDLWGGFPPTLKLRPPCRLKGSCHRRVPRGERKGVKAMDAGTSAPYIQSDSGTGFEATSFKWLKEVWEDLGGNWEGRRGRTWRSSLRSLVPFELSQTILEAMETWPSGTWRSSTLGPWLKP